MPARGSGEVVRVRVDPGRLASNTIGPAVFTVEVYNTDEVIRAYDLQVLGVDPAWCQVNTGDLSLFPGGGHNFRLFLVLTGIQ